MGDLDFEILFTRMRLGQRFDGVDAPRLSESGLCSVALSRHELPSFLCAMHSFELKEAFNVHLDHSLAMCILDETGFKSMHSINQVLEQA
jgi:hypothetical protein